MDTIQSAIVNALEAKFGASLKMVKAVEGPFDLADLNSFSIKPPALIVSYGGILGEGASWRHLRTQWFIVPVVIHKPGESRSIAAMKLSEAVYRWVRDELTNSVEIEGTPMNLRVVNEITLQTAQAGVALHEIPFQLDIESGPLTDAEIAALNDFLLAHTTIEHAETGSDDAPVTEDEIDIPHDE